MTRRSAEERICRARTAFANWSCLPESERRVALARLRRAIVARQDHIVDALVADTGKPPLDALSGDVLVTAEHLLFYERHAARILQPRRAKRSRLLSGAATFREHFQPHGVALIFGPANYPFQLALVPAVTALYAGNTVLLKVSEGAPRVAKLIAELAEAAELPADVLQVVWDGPQDAAAYIDANPDIVFFTGSSANGRRVAARAAERLIPTVLELGGKDPAIVFADCNLDRTVEGITYGAFSNAGQVCVGIKRLYIESPVYEEVVRRLSKRAAELRVGFGPDSDMGVLKREAAKVLFEGQVTDALKRGARIESAGDHLSGGVPLILSNVAPEARLLTEESFGPVLCVEEFATEPEAIALANSSPFALGASVWTRDRQRARRVALALHSGNCAINDVIRNIANPHAAFGGNAASGYGRYHGAHGLRAFSRVKTIMESRSQSRRQVNWFPFTQKTYTSLRALLELRHRPRGVLAALRRILGLMCLTLALSGALPAIAEGNAHLWMSVEAPVPARGSLAYLVFNSPEGFPQDEKKAIVHGFVPLVHGPIDLGELPPGRYAVSVYLDENGNHKLDSGLFGIPREPVGASNNPKARMGPPRFRDCAFELGSASRTISIRLVSPK